MNIMKIVIFPSEKSYSNLNKHIFCKTLRLLFTIVIEIYNHVLYVTWSCKFDIWLCYCEQGTL